MFSLYNLLFCYDIFVIKLMLNEFLLVSFTFRQGQVEIPSEIVLIDYTDVVLIDKKVITDRNRFNIFELENIKKQHSNHKMLKWEIDKCRVDLQNLEEQFKEYQLFTTLN